ANSLFGIICQSLPERPTMVRTSFILSLARRHQRPSRSSRLSHRQTYHHVAHFSSSDGSKNDDKPISISVAPTVQATSTSIGQVIFLNSQKSGNIILASLALADPTLAAFAAIGAVTSVSTSNLLGLDNSSIANGLQGYNGALIGCASSVFMSSLPFVVLGTVAGAFATPVVSASLKNVTSIPQWTWSFNLVMLTGLMRSRPLLNGESSEGAAESSDMTIESVIVEHSTSLMDVLVSPLTSISQIFVVNSPLSGLGILAATSLYSPALSLHALGGATTGCLVGLLLGDVEGVTAGLWGYNSALTSMAIGTFYVDSMKSRFLSAGAAAGTAVLFGGMSTVAGAYGIPCLTLPFCSVATTCYLLEGQIPGLKLAQTPHSPEKNM
ncbi:hypothetical protein ACHAXN_004476, partial [Cyclotella atomus]